MKRWKDVVLSITHQSDHEVKMNDRLTDVGLVLLSTWNTNLMFERLLRAIKYFTFMECWAEVSLLSSWVIDFGKISKPPRLKKSWQIKLLHCISALATCAKNLEEVFSVEIPGQFRWPENYLWIKLVSRLVFMKLFRSFYVHKTVW